MSRRKFLQQTGILTGGLLLHNQWLHAFNRPFEEKKIGIAIIGTGDRGTGIMHVLKELKDRFTITAVCDVLDFRLENGKKAAAEYNPKAFKDYRQVLNDKNTDAVVISVTLSEHYHIAKDALAAGKHVYLEKTMTYNIPQAIDLVKLAKARPNQVLQVGHQYRSTPLYFKVREMI